MPYCGGSNDKPMRTGRVPWLPYWQIVDASPHISFCFWRIYCIPLRHNEPAKQHAVPRSRGHAQLSQVAARPMNRNNTAFRAVQHAALEWTATHTPRSTRFGDVYYSDGEGIAESTHTFLQGNALPQRWSTHQARTFCIAETGFGTGLNFLLTWRAWQQAPAPKPLLHFISVEHYPLQSVDFAHALDQWPELRDLSAQLIDLYPAALPGCHRLVLEDGGVRLDLHWGEATDVLSELAAQSEPCVDAWYLDGFAPAKNDSMWQLPLLQAARTLSREGATLATFTAASAVRNALQEAGFSTTKVPGYGRKRESLRATAPTAQAPQPTPATTPWDLPQNAISVPETALVIGAGLAGCWSAHALAERGVAVTVLDRGALAGGASGNAQGVLYTRVSHKHSALVDFALLAFAFASRRYRQLFASGALLAGRDGDLCGTLQLLAAKAASDDIAHALAGLEDTVQLVDAAAASTLAGQSLERDAYWFPGSGWLDPAAVCRALLDSPRITLREHQGPISMRHRDGNWQALHSNGDVLAAAPCAVLAAGSGATDLTSLAGFPLRAIRGQTTNLAQPQTVPPLEVVVCDKGYIAPARDGQHCIGASFNLDDTESNPRVADHHGNLEKLLTALPGWRDTLQTLDPEALSGRVGFRCATPDYLPLIGPVPELRSFAETYAGLSHNAKRTIAQRGSYLPGLYVTTGHGSRGLTSTPLAAEVIASMICNEAAPLERSLCRAVSPARFIIRELMRKQVS